MLRRAAKRSREEPSHGPKNTKKKHKKRRNDGQVLGAKLEKNEAEKVLETLVIGGEVDLVEKLGDAQPRKHSEKESAVDGNTSDDGEDRKPVPAWQDEDEDQETITISKDAKHSHLHHSKQKKMSGDTYKKSLKTQFQKVSGTPDWAKLRWEKPAKSDDESDDELLQSTRTYLSGSESLPKGVLQMKRCTNANIESPSQCKLRCLEFHPSAQVILTAGANQTLNLFQVDGKQNPKIQSVFVERFPIMTAHFTRDGREVIMASKHKSFYYYDMMAGKIGSVPHIKGLEESSLKKFEMSPDGKFIVFLGKSGHMHLVSTQSKEWISTLKMNGNVASVAFTPEGETMYSIGNDGEVYVWDMKTRDCTHRFVDDGCIDGTAIDVSKNGQYLATGSYSGVVNVYDRASLTSPRPSPLRAIMNLTTPCTHVKFNATTEILAIASNYAEKALKMVHLPSMTVFSNFPTKQDPLRIPASMDFSLNSGYFSLGNHRGQALLYRVRHYGNY